jgi:hypothetical protein
VDLIVSHLFLSSLDVDLGYQIFVHPNDKEKISFIIDKETYYYNPMHLRLKNIIATYQIMINMVFKEQLGRNMKMYVDD